MANEVEMKRTIMDTIVNFEDARGNALPLSIADTKRLVSEMYQVLLTSGSLREDFHSN